MGAQMRRSGVEDINNNKQVTVYKNAQRTFKKGEAIAFPTGKGLTAEGKNAFPVEAPAEYKWIDLSNGKRGTQENLPEADPEASTTLRFFWTETTETEGEATELVIDPYTFPGTYRVVGDTKIRSEKTGKDEGFQFVINKCKLLSSVTLTLQAEGDPSTFSMTLNVLRDEDGNMMSLTKYTDEAFHLVEEAAGDEDEGETP